MSGNGSPQTSWASSADIPNNRKNVLGDGIGGGAGVPVGAQLQQVTKTQQRAGGHREGQFGILDMKAPGREGGVDIAHGSRRQTAIRGQQCPPIGQQDPALLRAFAKESSGQTEAAREHGRRVLDVGREPIQHGAVRVEDIAHSGLEQLFFALEVVVERPHPDVGGLSDLQNRNVELARRDHRLGSFDQCHPGPLLAALQPVDRRFGHGSPNVRC